jgi:hypothetical protein
MTTNTCDSECPICMEIIDLCKNCATTECGHKFHSNCLMKSIAFNGFGCPYCRFEMVEEIDDSEDEDDEEGEDEEGEGQEGDGDDDDDDEDDEDYEGQDDENENQLLPSFELIQKKFIDKGITYESLVKTIMFNSMIYHKNDNIEEYRKYNIFMEELFFDIVTKYQTEQEEEVNPNKNVLNFYFLQDEYSERKYQREMETALEKFIGLDDDNNENDNDSNILDLNSFIQDNFLNNRFMEVI